MSISVIQPGLFTTIQDLGRTGYQQYGVPVSGAMDRFSCQLANILVGNPVDAAVLEATLLGPTLSFDQDYLVAVTGADMKATLTRKVKMLSEATSTYPLCQAISTNCVRKSKDLENSAFLKSPVSETQDVSETIHIPNQTAFMVHAGDILSFSFSERGCRSYIAFSGGLDVPLQMGSRSTYTKVGLGGLNGRKLQAGDILETLKPDEPTDPSLADGLCMEDLISVEDSLSPEDQLSPEVQQTLKQPLSLEELLSLKDSIPGSSSGPVVLRVIPGPQEDEFTSEGMQTFLSSIYTVSDQSDRMGYRLCGEQIQHVHDGNIVSDGISFGSIQVPPSGQPIIMLADRQTTGGYPKIATVCSVDLGKIAQTKPEDQITFQAISVQEAQQLLLRQRRLLRSLEVKRKVLMAASDGIFYKPFNTSATLSFHDYEISVNGKVYQVHVEEISR